MSQARIDWLDRELNRTDISDELATQYNNEANQLQAQINEAKAQAVKRAQTILEQNIARISELIKAGRMVAVVEEFGSEFVDNYTITESFMVVSSCFNPRNPNGTNCWQFNSLEEAQTKKFQLIYWRVYDRYFRNGAPAEFGPNYQS